MYMYGELIFFYVNFSRWRYRVGLFTANVIWRYLPLSNQPWQSFGFSSACFIWHCFFSLHKDKLQILKLRKIPLETLGKTKEGCLCPLLPFRPPAFPIQRLRNIYLFLLHSLCLRSHIIVSFQVSYALISHSFPTQPYWRWTHSVGWETKNAGMFKPHFKTSSRRNSHGWVLTHQHWTY